MPYGSLSLSSFVLAIAGQILPPVVDQPTTILQPPAGYPPTVATSATGPYFATPAWDQVLAPNVRFVVLTNFSSHAVLDRETGLVWSRQATVALPGLFAESACRSLVLANRSGWRLPSVAELKSLLDFSNGIGTTPLFPTGHPFLLPAGQPVYWTGDIGADGTEGEGRYVVNIVGGFASLIEDLFVDSWPALCVRGHR
jgi:hypothetical protein